MSHGAGSLIFQWDSTIKPPCLCILAQAGARPDMTLNVARTPNSTQPMNVPVMLCVAVLNLYGSVATFSLK